MDEAVHGPGIDPERLAVCLSVLEELDRLDVDHPDAIKVPGDLAHLPRGQTAPPPGAPGRQDRPRPRRHRGHRDRLRRAHRRRDRGHPALLQGRGRQDRGHTPAPPVLLHLQDPVRGSRLLLPPALSRLRASNRAKRDARADLTGKRALLTGGRAKIGMYIALRLLPRRRAHDDHDAGSPRTPSAASRRWRTRRTGCTAWRSSASTCATRPRPSRWPTRSPRPARWIS